MKAMFYIILLHQVIFQGMFLIKNLIVRRNIKGPVRGSNREANIAIVFFTFYITLSLVISYVGWGFGAIPIMSEKLAMIVGIIFLAASLIVSGLSLVDLSDSWRVGVIEEEKTELVTTGIYRITRNPYFLSYLIMFAGYVVLLQNAFLLLLSLPGFLLIHNMILKEERYLKTRHGENYAEYIRKVPRYLIV